MRLKFSLHTAIVTFLLLLAGGLPLAWFLLQVSAAPSIRAEEAIRRLNQPGASVVLLDVRPAADYALLHVSGARSVPLEVLAAWPQPGGLPRDLSGAELLLLGDSGFDSAPAAHLLRAAAIPATSVSGGMQEWAKAGYRLPNLRYAHFSLAGQETLAFTPLSVGEQAVQLIAGFGIKPLYMLINLVLWALLLRFPQARTAELNALGWGLAFFFVGEFFCYVNFLAFGDDSYLCEYLHSFGMAAAFAFVFYALIEALEVRLLHLDQLDRPCAAVGLCRVCTRQQGLACRARRLYQLAFPTFGLLCAIPLTAQTDLRGTTGLVFGFPYFFGRFAIYQLYENRFLPWLALILFGLGFAGLWARGRQSLPWFSRVCLCAGLGALCFAFFRLALGSIFAPNAVFFTFWEEFTELMFIIGSGLILYTFRRAFGRSQ